MQPARDTPDDPAVLATIREAADRHAVPRHVALAFAWVESRLDPNAMGDLDWPHRDGGARYRQLVLDHPKFAFNPYRNSPELWHSYGLFQLLACWHTRAAECPLELAKPAVNADRGCAEIARLLKLARGDVRAARLAYVGCGLTGIQCSQLVRDTTLTKLSIALRRYESEARPC